MIKMYTSSKRQYVNAFASRLSEWFPKTAQRPPENPGPRAARLNGFYTYICLRKLRV